MNLSAWAAGAAWASRRAVLSRRTWATVTVIVVIAAGVVGYVFGHGRGKPSVAAPKPVTPTQTAKPKPAEKGFRVIVPSIGADAPVISVGADQGALDVPSSVHQVGWWDGIYTSSTGKVVHEKVAAPGQSGVALLAGHIDSAAQGHGVFYKLSSVKPGATVKVIDKKNKVTYWKVTKVQTVLKSALPAALFVDKGKPQVALVSCGGPFDSASGHYLDNIIAWTVPAPAPATTEGAAG